MPVENERPKCVQIPREITRPCRQCNGHGHGTVLNGAFFRDARERAGITQEDMARACEVSGAYLCQMETGDRAFLPRYADVYDQTIERRRRSGATA